MSKPYSDDLRGRVVSSVIENGLSRRQAAERYDLGISTVIRWVARFEETGSFSPGRSAATSRVRSRAGIATGWWNAAAPRPSPCAAWWPNWLDAG